MFCIHPIYDTKIRQLKAYKILLAKTYSFVVPYANITYKYKSTVPQSIVAKCLEKC